ncbi:NigD-like protein [Bacteroides sp.]|uniref:NigD-like protein n=1 Tax=Bacteroides sp. TaxID=29523 RepID=UPI0023C009B6|nr:NigD-like protein [Bacteroides sp.]MDE5710259.1 NigD-like protein [Bacteroides sp.]MDE6216455.1 NigD-like protein [Bacteroides sp.]
MKKLHGLLMAICLAVMPVLQSCSDDDGYSIGDFTPPLWATVRVTGNAFYLDSDVWGTLWPVNTDLGWYEAVDGQRVLTVVNPLWDNYEGYDHAVKLLRLQNVLTKGIDTLTPETEEEFGNDPVVIYQGDITISGGYMNIFFVQNLPSKNKHRISLVRPQADEELYGEDGYIHLELRYNDFDDVTNRQAYGAVSYNLNSLDITDETKGIKLKLNSQKNGEVEVTLDLKSSDADNVKSRSDADLSGMQLK